MPLVVGLTGSIGSGKSSVLRMLVALGADGVDADRVAHGVMLPGNPAYQAVRESFGNAILAPDGQIDRQKLGRVVFADAGALSRLEAIVHPAVYEAIRAQIRGSLAPMVAIEAIKLLESGLARRLCHEVWVTVCRPEQQHERLSTSRGMQADEIQRRMLAQMPSGQMEACATRLIDTSGTLAETAAQVFLAWIGLHLPMPPIEVRAAEVGDEHGIAALLGNAVASGDQHGLRANPTPEAVRSFLEGLLHGARAFVAESGGVLVGLQVIHQGQDRRTAPAEGGTFSHVAAPVAAVVQEALDRALSLPTEQPGRLASAEDDWDRRG